MKKNLYIFLVSIVVFIGWYCLTNRGMQKQPSPEQTNIVTEIQPKTNPSKINPNIPIKIQRPTNSNETNEPINEMTNALTAMNIEQWKAAIKGLHKMPGLSESWHMEQTNQEEYIPVTLGKNGQTIDYKVRFIDISIKNQNGDILEAQLRSPMMNIAETRELGLQLCNMLGDDPKDFLAWCDKVGNHWLDTPLYSVRDHYYGFETFHTSNDEKPWSVSFEMMNP
jgi:hypothetical protein